jgi:hypothetical protein
MPGYPKPRPEIQQRAATPKPPAPTARVRMRLGWSRSIVDGARGMSAPAEGPVTVPNVRSTAALRARAGEPPPRVVLPEPEPEPVVVIQRVAPPRRIPAPQWEPAPIPPAPSFFATTWSAIRELWNGLPRAPQISD